MKKAHELNPFEQWMVESNLQRISEEGLEVKAVVELLRARGYDHIASAVEAESLTRNLQPAP